jgi:hypothetical protein
MVLHYDKPHLISGWHRLQFPHKSISRFNIICINSWNEPCVLNECLPTHSCHRLYNKCNTNIYIAPKRDLNKYEMWHLNIMWGLVAYPPITVAARPKAWTVFASSNTGIVGSNPIRDMDVCVRLCCVCVLCVGSGLVTDWSPVQGLLPTAYRIKKLKRRPRPNKGP